MLTSLIREGLTLDVLISLCVMVFVVFCTVPIHEYAHALVATKLGDDTPRLKGRLTLNPLAHIDLFGALMLFVVGFGFAKPVPVNARRFKNPKRGMVLTALAGPAANIIMALFFMLLSNTFFYVFASNPATVWSVAYQFFYIAASVNASLAVFNLLPIPPLDGSKILNAFLPAKYYFKIMQYERYIVLAVMALLIFNVLDKPIYFLSGIIMEGVSWVAALPFRLLF